MDKSYKPINIARVSECLNRSLSLMSEIVFLTIVQALFVYDGCTMLKNYVDIEIIVLLLLTIKKICKESL